ncbi:MAG: hypothetical protein BJ554DRAFT_7070, partial [Olpidium bornovanus]
ARWHTAAAERHPAAAEVRAGVPRQLNAAAAERESRSSLRGFAAQRSAGAPPRISGPPQRSAGAQRERDGSARAGALRHRRSLRLVIPPLEEGNWSTWKEDMRAVLLRRGQWDWVTGDEPRPDESTIMAQRREWARTDGEAFGEIYLHVGRMYKHLLKGALSVKDAWNALAANFEDVGSSVRVDLIQDLYTMRMEATESVDKYVARVKGQVQRLVDLGEENDWPRVTRDIILTGSLHLKGKDKQKEKSKEKSKGTTDDSDDSAHLIHTDDDNVALLVASPANTTEWILDTGSSYHIAASASALEDLKDLPSARSLRVGNNAQLLASKIGRARLTFSTGRLGTVDNVHVVLGITKNLLSVGMLAQK